MTTSDVLTRIDQTIEQGMETYIGWLARLCAQPSVAAQNQGIKECADLVAAMLKEQGYSAEILPTPGSPVVLGEGGQGSRTLLFYNHYDVQPAEPFELWESPPFELTRKGDLLVARGVGDDKGHLVTRLAALAAIKQATGKLPCKVKFVVEGEEEIGSVHLPEFVVQHKDRLAADACIWEFGQVDYEGHFEQILGMRGIMYVELSARTADVDTHSGTGGSIFPNAAWRLVWALATLKDPNERILIPGFYDNVLPPTERDLQMLAALPDKAAKYKESFGVKTFLKGMTGGVELGRAEVFEPTCTICGLTSGYQGAGSKTIIPAEARAKVDFRLVPNQSPDEILEKLRQHLDAQGFADVEITPLGGEHPARTNPDDPFVQIVGETAREVYGSEPVVRPIVGGSGPNYPFIEVLGLPVAMAGIGHYDGKAHAPNENIVMENFVKGIKHTARIVLAFSEM